MRLSRLSCASSDMELPKLTLVMCLSAAVLAGCGKVRPSSDYLHEAQRYHEKGDDRAAIIQLKNALQKDENNVEARFMLGSLYQHAGNYAGAEDELKKTLNTTIDQKKVLEALAEVYLERGEFQHVLDDVRIDKDMSPEEQARFLVSRGNAHLGLNQMDKAQANYSTALQLVPGFLEAQLGQARLLAISGKSDQAMAQVKQILSVSPNTINAWLLQGDLLKSKNDMQGALASYQRALKIDSTHPAALLDAAFTSVALGHLNEARDYVTTLEKMMPRTIVAKYLLGVIAFREGQYQKATDSLSQAMKSIPDYLPGVFLMGMVDFQLGSLESAQQSFSRVAAAFPEDPIAIRMLAMTQLRMKRPDAALKTLDPFLQKTDADPDLLSIGAQAAVETKNYAQAANMLARSSAAHPASSQLRTELGLTHLATGHTEQAIADLEAAIKLDPSRMQAGSALIVTYLGKHDYQKALTEIQHQLKLHPQSADFYNFQGAAYLGLNDLTHAEKSFKQALALDAHYVPGRLNLGELYLQLRRTDAARQQFQTVLDQDPKNEQAMLFMAGLAQASGDLKGWNEWLEKAAQANPGDLRPRLQLAQEKLSKGDAKGAVKEAEEAAKSNPGNVAALDFLGSMQLQAKMTKDAVQTFKEEVDQHQSPTQSAQGYLHLAIAQVADSDNLSAEVSLQRALDLSPGYADALAALMTLDLKSGHVDKASEVVMAYQAKFPRSAIGFLAQGDLEMSQKQYTEAVKSYEQAQSREPSTLGIVKLHDALSQAGQEKQADQRLAQWVGAHPSDMAARSYLATMDLRAGRDRDAAEQYQQLLQRAPNDLTALNNLAWLYQRTHDSRAIVLAQRAYKLSPDNPQVMDTLGWIMVQGQTDVQGGLGMLKKATEAAPQVPDIRFHYAVALAKTGDKTEAKDILKQLLDSGVAFPQKEEAKQIMKNL